MNDEQPTIFLWNASTIFDEAVSHPSVFWARYSTFLDEIEKARFKQLKREERRIQFLLGRVMLKTLVMLFQKYPTRDFAHTIHVVAPPRQAPYFAQLELQDWKFSLSHSRHYIACALIKNANLNLGLDIEIIDENRDVLALSQQAFGSAFTAYLEAKFKRNKQDAVREFYMKWSDQEARFKMSQDLSLPAYVIHDFTYDGINDLMLPQSVPLSQLAISLCVSQNIAYVPAIQNFSLLPNPIPNTR